MFATEKDIYIGHDDAASATGYEHLKYESLGSHLRFLTQSSLGMYVHDSLNLDDITFVETKRANDSACYEYGVTFSLPRYIRRAIKTKGDFFAAAQAAVQHNVKYGEVTSALTLGHELRHVQWNIVNSAEALTPTSVEERIVWDRFMEADGRAIEFGILAQLSVYHADYNYFDALIKSRESYTYDFCGHSFFKLQQIGRDPNILRQSMRAVFDFWTSISPGQNSYEENTLARVTDAKERAHKRGLKGALNRLVYPDDIFTKVGTREEFVRALVENMGTTDNGNYLTQTEGADFMEPCYLQTCNYRLERLIAPTAPTVPHWMPQPMARALLPFFMK